MGVLELCEIVYGLICFAGLIANSVTLYIICVSISSKTRGCLTARCIFNLSLCDLIAVLLLPFFIATMNSGWNYGLKFCELLTFIQITEQFAKAFILSLLGITSYAQYRGSVYQLTKTKMLFLFLSVWIPSLLLSSIFVLLLDERYQCDLFCSSYFHFKETFTFIYTICVFVVPIIVLVLLLRQSRSPPFERTEAVIELFELTIALLSVHIILTAGHVLGQLINTFHRLPPGFPEPDWKIRWTMFAGIIWYTTRFVFPLVYGLMWTEFRKSALSLFTDIYEYRPMTRFNHNNVGHI